MCVYVSLCSALYAHMIALVKRFIIMTLLEMSNKQMNKHVFHLITLAEQFIITTLEMSNNHKNKHIFNLITFDKRFIFRISEVSNNKNVNMLSV